MKNQMLIYVLVTAVIAGGAGFFGGMQFQKSQNPGGFAQGGQGRGGNFQSRNGTGGQFQGRNGGGRVFGEVLNKDDKTLTVKMADGSSKIVLFTDKTVFNKSTAGAKTDIEVGKPVSVIGTTNTDGSVTATDVQINPVLRPMVSGTPKQ
jgi:hypothetical protein